jgi:diguanylate cyclase (GGDEF)-like protein
MIAADSDDDHILSSLHSGGALPIRTSPRTVKRALLLVGVFAALHALIAEVGGRFAMAGSYILIFAACVGALISCVRAARAHQSPTRGKWAALSVGVFLWTTGLAISGVEDLWRINEEVVTAFGGFIYFLFGAPILLAICATANDRRIPAVIWIDAAMATAIGVLSYLEIFSVLPALGNAPSLTVSHIALSYDAENLMLAALATVRLLAVADAQDREFYAKLVLYLWLNAGAAAFNNHLVVIAWQATVGQPWDFIIDLPFLILALAALEPPHLRPASPGYMKPSTVRLIQAGISISLPLTLLVLGILVTTRSPGIGVLSVVGSLGAYGLRNMLLQADLLGSEEKLKESSKVLEDAALVDALTGVGNRRAFDEALQRQWQATQRNGRAFALLLIDIDYFKSINDTYGHQSGDECLVAIAGALKRVLPRAGDLLARYGGEEFACILAETNQRGALTVAERMRQAVYALQIKHPGSDFGVLTVSVGATAGSDASNLDARAMLRLADQALYQAKRKGRNRIEESDVPLHP